MGIIMILFWGVVIVAIALAISGMISNHRPSHRDAHEVAADALEILRRRYARGEIDKQQFEAMRRDLAEDHIHA